MWEFPWISSETLACQRMFEELAKRGSGEKKVELSVSLSWINTLDIFTNFRLQDPYAPDVDGAGDVGAYYFVESIGYDFVRERLQIVAIDTIWLTSQFCILGDEDKIATNWVDATKEQQRYCYLAHAIEGELPFTPVGAIYKGKMLSSEGN